jgi:hypothetical protein
LISATHDDRVKNMGEISDASEADIEAAKAAAEKRAAETVAMEERISGAADDESVTPAIEPVTEGNAEQAAVAAADTEPGTPGPEGQKARPKENIIANFNPQTGEKLDPAGQIALVRKQHPDMFIPKFDGQDGHQLTSEEQVDKLKKLYS